MIAYVPRKRYLSRPELRNFRGGVTWERFIEWKLYKKYGGIYDLKWDCTRPATPEEYEGRKKLKIFPDDFKGLIKTKTGPKYWR